MKLAQLKVTNFRCYKEETILDIDDLTVLIGKNDAGKSSLFDAMNIFFDSKVMPDIDDLSVGAENKEIRISCAFSDIPKEIIIDAEHSTNLADEYLLNEESLLEIVKIFDCSSEKPKEKGIYLRADHPTASGVDDLHSLTNTQLKNRVKDLLGKDSEAKMSINADMRKKLWRSKKDLDKKVINIEVSKGDAKTIWSKIKDLLPVFSLFKVDRSASDQDSETKDPMKAIVKEVIKSHKSELDNITKNIEIEVETMAQKIIEKVVEMNQQFENQLNPKISADNWDKLFNISLASHDGIKVNKRGSGTRKLILLSFFRVKAEEESDDSGTGVIYAFEEPETSQHPDNQLRLIKAFEDIAMRSDSQVLFSTHTPNLARKLPYNSLRFVTTKDDEENDKPIIYHGRETSAMTMIVNALGVLPDHGVKVFFGVEGKHDIEFLKTISRNLSKYEANIPDLEQAEESGKLIFFFMGGCGNLGFWASKLSKLNIPEFYLIDGDNCPSGNHKQQKKINEHRNNGHTVWVTNKRELENYIHLDLIKSQYPNYSGTGASDENVPKLCSDSSGDKEKKVKQTLNNKKVISKMTPAMLSAVDTDDEVRGWLMEVGQLL